MYYSLRDETTRYSEHLARAHNKRYEQYARYSKRDFSTPQAALEMEEALFHSDCSAAEWRNLDCT